jgi:hypothetical protein
MPQIEFTGQSAQDAVNIAANPSRLVNCYREPVLSGGRTGYTIKSAPGMSEGVTIADPVRALLSVAGTLYAAAADGLFSVQTAGVTRLGDTPVGDHAALAGNNGNLTLTIGGEYRVWNGSTVSAPAPGAFSGFSGHDYIANYTVLTERGGRRFQWSAIANPASLPGLSFSTADGRDDNLVRPVEINGALYLFKETSHEIWYVTGGAGADAFERQTGGVVGVGLKSHDLICKVPGGAFFIGDDDRAHLVFGAVQPVSIPAVETAIRLKSARACFMYEAFGHTFCAVTFTDRAAWIYDISTGEWHERAEGAYLAPWSATCTAKHNGKWYVGRQDTVLKFSDADADGETPLVREITSRTLEIDRQWFTVDLLEMFPRQGFNVQALELEVSRDGGLTWSMPKAAPIGPVGQYGKRVTWRCLGRARQFTARLRASEADDFTIAAECELVLRR